MTTEALSRKGNENRDIITSLRLTPDEHAKLKRLAYHERRSLSNQLRHLLAQADDVEQAA